jgi:hypothetical protein
MTQLKDVDTATIEQRLQTLTEQARTACSQTGAVSSECAAAWDAVEEVQAEMADRRFLAKSEFERFCQERPEAAECRIYDV